jgi:hypothetical protein
LSTHTLALKYSFFACATKKDPYAKPVLYTRNSPLCIVCLYAQGFFLQKSLFSSKITFFKKTVMERLEARPEKDAHWIHNSFLTLRDVYNRDYGKIPLPENLSTIHADEVSADEFVQYKNALIEFAKAQFETERDRLDCPLGFGFQSSKFYKTKIGLRTLTLKRQIWTLTL